MNLRAGHRHLEVLVTWLTFLLSTAEPHSCWPQPQECHNALSAALWKKTPGYFVKISLGFPWSPEVDFWWRLFCNSFGNAFLHDSSTGCIGHCSLTWWREQGVEAWFAKEMRVVCKWVWVMWRKAGKECQSRYQFAEANTRWGID